MHLIGAVKTRSACGEFVVPLFFMLRKMKHKVGPCVLGLVLVITSGNGMVVDTGLLEGFECQFNSGSVRNGVATSDSDTADDANALPKVFKGLVGVPLLGEFSVVAFQIGRSELAICGSEVR